MTGAIEPFDGNDYRKRVLAAVERRGGPDASDPFELYDLPVDRAAAGELDDAEVAARVAEVWGFWQRQRDHPKYRVLVGLLVDAHAERSAELLDAGRRRLAASRVRLQREQRDSARYALLDAAISRLVDRHRGIPRDKIDGLHEVGALAGLARPEVEARLRRHRVLDPETRPPAPAEPGVSPQRRSQVRALLEELGRLTDSPAPPTLLALLGLDADATDEQIRAHAGAWRARARELPPERRRAVVDELLVHVAELLEPGRDAVAAYLAAVAADVTEHLRPRVRAAVLVEDRLVAEDHAHLLEEAIALGLDRTRAVAVLAALAAELGAPVDDRSTPTARPSAGRSSAGRSSAGRPLAAPPAAARPPAAEQGRAWEEPLKAARAAMRAGKPMQAQQLVRQAERLAGPDARGRVRAVTDEVAAVLAEAERRRQAATAAYRARRYTEALGHLEHLERVAKDVHDPAEMLGRARGEVERADRAVAAADTAADRAAALLAVLDACPDHPGAVAALARIPVLAPAWVSAARDGAGGVLVLWADSATPGVTYRVRRQRPDGSWQVVGRVPGTALDDGGAPAGVEPPVYAVAALQGGRSSEETRSDGPAGPSQQAPSRQGPAVARPAARSEDGRSSAAPGSASSTDGAAPDAAAPDAAAPDAPRDVRAVRLAGGSVEVSWCGGPDLEYRVRALGPDGRWRVVGRTRARRIEDGGAPSGAMPVYAVSAAAGGARSEESRSDPT